MGDLATGDAGAMGLELDGARFLQEKFSARDDLTDEGRLSCQPMMESGAPKADGGGFELGGHAAADKLTEIGESSRSLPSVPGTF